MHTARLHNSTNPGILQEGTAEGVAS